MNRAFTLIELMIVIAIFGIVASIAIPNLVEAQKARASQVGEVYIGYHDIIGKTFSWNGNKTLVVDYNSDWKYVVVIMPTSGGAVNAVADRSVIMDAYKASLKTPQSITAEKVEQ